MASDRFERNICGGGELCLVFLRSRNTCLRAGLVHGDFPMLQGILIRHCEATGQEPQAALTKKGAEQALSIAEALRTVGIKRVVSSHFKRAVESVAPLSATCNLAVEIDQRLAERTLGESSDWRAALARTYSEPDLRFPGGESTNEATARAREVIDQVLAQGPHPVAFVTHGNLLSLIARSFDPAVGFEFWEKLSNPDLFELHKEGDLISLRPMPL